MAEQQKQRTNRLISYAYRLLGSRDYSRYELEQKLKQKSQALDRNKPADSGLVLARDEIIAEILAYLSSQGLQDERRFGESYVRQGIKKGWGPIKLKHKLAEKGLTAELIDELLAQDEDFWRHQVSCLITNRYELPFANLQEKQKCYRFLASRGFSAAQILAVINNL